MNDTTAEFNYIKYNYMKNNLRIIEHEIENLVLSSGVDFYKLKMLLNSLDNEEILCNKQILKISINKDMGFGILYNDEAEE